ncbi:RHS repeat-associated core domain-containing protein, partial [Neisseria sp. 83E34]|uniref:RHS repeat-associated core domain-containing protein n=1 Tax=Neisseria sp. 83E34 TaxID=1692264 RepID=UPI000A541EB7
TQEENARNGLIATDWRDPQYDMLFQPVTNSIRYHYDFNGNRTTTVLPDGRQINYLYYGSGHLHQINLDGEVITDIERDKLHREIQRTQGALTSRYELDPLGRLKAQIAQLNGLSENGKAAVGAGYIPARMHGQTAVKRSYGYDKTGNLLHSSDQRTGTTHFEYDKLGRITQAGDERFAFDPAHNILSTNGQTVSDGLNAVTDNRIKYYNGISYYYDELGNLIHRELPNGEVQNYFYDLHDQLVKVEIFKKDSTKETWVYRYDALGRRVSKGRLKMENANEVSDRHSTDHACLNTPNSKDILDSEIAFLWDGSHLLQEHNSDGLYTYIYTDQDSYEPLAQIHNYTNTESESRQETNYFHCDQIGIPREMTDKDGNLLWFGDYYGWGKLKSETNVTETAHQPFRLQNQYCDEETGLHYNFFRYYESDAGRFINQDPIKLKGGNNFYIFAPNIGSWIDILGWVRKDKDGKPFYGVEGYIECNNGKTYHGLSTRAKKNRPGAENNKARGATNQAVADLYRKRGDPSYSQNGKCAEAGALSKLADENNLTDEDQLAKYIQTHECKFSAYKIRDPDADDYTGDKYDPCPCCSLVIKFLQTASIK